MGLEDQPDHRRPPVCLRPLLLLLVCGMPRTGGYSLSGPRVGYTVRGFVVPKQARDRIGWNKFFASGGYHMHPPLSRWGLLISTGLNSQRI